MTTGTRRTGASGRPVPQAATERRCTVCHERLSTYNPGPNCYAHTANVPWRGPTMPAR